MARLHGLFGKATGKFGDGVFAVKNGQQTIRQYNPIVNDPASEGQVASRARLKLMSQLAQALAPILAIPKEGTKSTRNLFVAMNYALTSFAEGVASIHMNALQLTKSALGMVDFSVDRSSGTAMACSLKSDSSAQFDAVVYAAVTVSDNFGVHVLGSTLVSAPGAGGVFAGVLPYSAESVVVYAYGIKYGNRNGAMAFENMSGDAAEFVAKLVTSRSVKLSGAKFTECLGAGMKVGETQASSDDTVRYSVSVSVTGDGTVSGAGSFEEGATCTLVATPGSGANFAGYYENGVLVSDNATYSFQVSASRTIEARFSNPAQEHTLTIANKIGSVQGADLGHVPAGQFGAGQYAAGASATCYPGTEDEYNFMGWYDANGTQIESSMYLHYEMPDSDSTIYVIWQSAE